MSSPTGSGTVRVGGPSVVDVRVLAWLIDSAKVSFPMLPSLLRESTRVKHRCHTYALTSSIHHRNMMSDLRQPGRRHGARGRVRGPEGTCSQNIHRPVHIVRSLHTLAMTRRIWSHSEGTAMSPDRDSTGSRQAGIEAGALKACLVAAPQLLRLTQVGDVVATQADRGDSIQYIVYQN